MHAGHQQHPSPGHLTRTAADGTCSCAAWQVHQVSCQHRIQHVLCVSSAGRPRLHLHHSARTPGPLPDDEALGVARPPRLDVGVRSQRTAEAQHPVQGGDACGRARSAPQSSAGGAGRAACGSRDEHSRRRPSQRSSISPPAAQGPGAGVIGQGQGQDCVLHQPHTRDTACRALCGPRWLASTFASGARRAQVPGRGGAQGLPTCACWGASLHKAVQGGRVRPGVQRVGVDVVRRPRLRGSLHPAPPTGSTCTGGSRRETRPGHSRSTRG